jgi:hypothetical protein
MQLCIATSAKPKTAPTVALTFTNSNSEFSALASGVLLLFACLLRPGPVVIQLLTSHREWAGNGCPLSV